MAKLKYGIADSKQNESYYTGAFYASQKLLAKSGRFVVYDISDGYMKACADNAAAVTGYVEEVMTTSATNGGTSLRIIDVRGKTFELPYAASGAAATLTEAVGKALIGKKIDLYVDADGVQYADNAANQAAFRVAGYNVAENTLLVSVLDANIVSQA